MEVPFLAFIALALCAGILTNAFNNLVVIINTLQTKRFHVLNISLFTHERLIFRVTLYGLVEISLVSVCTVYWILQIIFHCNVIKRLKRKREKIGYIMDTVWNRLIRPITIIIFIVSIYTTVLAFDDSDLFKSDMSNFFVRVFDQLQKNDFKSGKLNCVHIMS